MVGTDIAELLLRDHRTVWLPGKSPSEANLIDFTHEPAAQVEEESGEAQLSFLTDSQAATTLEKDTERFRELLLYGRKKVSGPSSGAGRGAGPALGAPASRAARAAGVLFCKDCLAPRMSRL